MKRLCTWLLIAVTSASLTLGTTKAHASGPTIDSLTNGVTFNMAPQSTAMASAGAMTATMSALQSRAEALLAAQTSGYANEWEQEAIVFSCDAGGRSCIGNNGGSGLISGLTLAEVIQLGLTNSSSGPPFVSEVLYEHYMPISATSYRVTAMLNIAGPEVGGTSSGAGVVFNGAPTSTSAGGLALGTRTTGYSLVDRQSPASTLVQGISLANNQTEKLNLASLSVTLTGPIATWVSTNGTNGPASISPGTVNFNVKVSSNTLSQRGVNLLLPANSD